MVAAKSVPSRPELRRGLVSGYDGAADAPKLFEYQLHAVTDDLLDFVNQEVDAITAMWTAASSVETGPQEESRNCREHWLAR